MESPSEEMIDPRYLNDVTSSRRSPFFNVVVLGAILLLTIILLFSALISIQQTRALLSNVVVRSCSSSSVPAIRSMSSANWRLLISLPFIDIVPLKLCTASSMIFSRHKLNSTGDKRHPWRSPTDVRNDCPISPSLSTAIERFE